MNDENDVKMKELVVLVELEEQEAAWLDEMAEQTATPGQKLTREEMVRILVMKQLEELESNPMLAQTMASQCEERSKPPKEAG